MSLVTSALGAERNGCGREGDRADRQPVQPERKARWSRRERKLSAVKRNRLTLHLSAEFMLDCEMNTAPANDSRLTVGRTARLAEVGIPTMRFYERAGLLPKPTRTGGNYRLYSNEAVTRIRFIRRAQQLGFTLKEIKDLLELRVDRKNSCSDVRHLAGEKVADIEARIRSLQKMRKALLRLAEQCDAAGGKSTCPLLDYLESDL